MLRKAVRLLFSVLLAFALLVATHLGEFWPFSIYPMFSQAGNPWSRAMVHQVDPHEVNVHWETISSEQKQGELFALKHIGYAQNDLSNLVSKNEDWSPQRLQGMRRFFGDYLEENGYIIYRVHGDYSDEDPHEIDITFTPYLYFLPDTSYVNPKLLEE